MRGRRHAAAGRRLLRVVVFTLVGLMVLGGGVAYGAYRFDRAQTGRILPGVTIAGVDVGEMTRAEAIAAVGEAIESDLSQEIEVRARGRSWHVTPAELGTRGDIEEKVDRALAVGEGMAWHERAFARIFDRPVQEDLRVRLRRDGEMIKRFLGIVSEATYVSPNDASFGIEEGELVLTRPKMGRELDVKRSRERVRSALRQGKPLVTLPVSKVEPDVTADGLGLSIVVRISENRLYLYDGFKVIKRYDVATGTGGYPTPQGTWNIWDKRENPVWVNPAPDGWGADLPAVIGPGPGNPLGTHALYLDAPGIRIHGTYAEDTIGTFASHGCIRMRIEESKELFGMIPIGTKVHILP
ncbi:MAG TPA: L,D-transpeptidase/peptidoglycan binding protein [Actinomycetota bacterium]